MKPLRTRMFNRARSASYARCVTILLLPLLAFGQQLPSRSNDQLGVIFRGVAQKILGSCQSWPPKLATKSGDQSRNANDSHLVDGTDLLTSQFFGPVKVDPGIKPYIYDALYLRMLDSVGTYDSNVSNDQLLGIAQTADPTQLFLWGTDMSTVKYDCMSMLGLVAQAGVNYSIPFFSLNAAFKASENSSTNQTSTFLYGTFQSPFDTLYTSQDPAQVVFAGMKAIAWRLNVTNPSQDQYIATSRILSVIRSSTASETSSVLGNIKAGVTIPIVSASGSVDGQLARALQANANSYITYFWDPRLKNLPDQASLVSRVSMNLPQFIAPATDLAQGVPVSVQAVVSGWPEALCASGQWTPVVKNANLIPGLLTMNAGTASGNLPACNINISFSLTTAAVKASDVTNPQLVFRHNKDSRVEIPVQLTAPLRLAGKTSVTLDFVPAKWNVITAANAKTALQWQVSGHVDVPSGRVIQSIAIKGSDVTCKLQDNSSLPVNTVAIEGSADPVFRPGSDSKFILDANLSLVGTRSYNDDFGQANKKTCAITGVLNVDTASTTGGAIQSEALNFQSNLVYYPNELPSTPPPTPSNLVTSGVKNSEITLSWTPTAGAASYTVYRSTSAGTEVPVKTGSSGPPFSDTGLTNGVCYYYFVTASNAAGESGKSAEVSATPLAPPTAPINVVASGGSGSPVSLSWTLVTGTTSYNVYRSTAPGTEVLIKPGLTASPFQDTIPSAGITYYYQVSALNAAGESNRSGEVSAPAHQ